MGTRVAPSYANLFIGHFEETYIYSNPPFKEKIHLYKRYIDDLFFLWEGSEEEALNFTVYLNNNSWGISFSPEFGTLEIDFLDLSITHKEKFSPLII